ncbi:MAG: rhomboid family intramembrane serine protease [Gemmatimonadales bacterium]
MGPQSSFSLTPWVRRLLVANLLVFVLQVTVFTSRGFIGFWAFDPLSSIVRPWTALTYMFLHGGFLHLALNLLMLVIFAPAVEEAFGGRRFILYYVWCGLGGPVLASLVALGLGRLVTPFVGASGALFGVALAFGWRWPDAPIYMFPLPVPIKAKYLVVFLLGIGFLLWLFNPTDRTAHLAHLGGFAFGFLYLKSEQWMLARAERHVRRSAPATNVLVHPAAARAMKGGGTARRSSAPRAHDTTTAEVDRVLDKISAKGIQSLTPEERKFLVEMSRKMRKDS